MAGAIDAARRLEPALRDGSPVETLPRVAPRMVLWRRRFSRSRDKGGRKSLRWWIGADYLDLSSWGTAEYELILMLLDDMTHASCPCVRNVTVFGRAFRGRRPPRPSSQPLAETMERSRDGRSMGSGDFG